VADSLNQIKYLALAQACDEILSNENAVQAYKQLCAYIEGCQKMDAGDQGNWEALEDKVVVWQPFEHFTPHEVLETIEGMAQGIEEAMKSVLELAKEGIIQETIEGRLDSDMNSLDMVELVEIGHQAQAEHMTHHIDDALSAPRPTV
tara:strand:+ start:49839 stop:50279 length:441 start_codon:yes stop_codon:yes gene_type:complete